MLERVQEIKDYGFHKKTLENMYHDLLLENAIHSIVKKEPNIHYQYAEEFIANTLYMLELGMEQEAMMQFEIVEYMIKLAHQEKEKKTCFHTKIVKKQTKSLN